MMVANFKPSHTNDPDLVLPSVQESLHVISRLTRRSSLYFISILSLLNPFHNSHSKHTVLATLEILKVFACVNVVTILGIGKNVLASTTLLVGHSGLVFVAVIEVGGTGCIGAYFVKPFCRLYGVPHAPSSNVPDDAAAAALVTSLMVAGPVVPETVAKAVVTAAEKTPVIPVSVKRFEKFVTVPPAVAVLIIPRKLYIISNLHHHLLMKRHLLCICSRSSCINRYGNGHCIPTRKGTSC